MKLEEVFEKFQSGVLKIDLGDKIFSLELKLEEKEQKPEIVEKIGVHKKNIKQLKKLQFAYNEVKKFK